MHDSWFALADSQTAPAQSEVAHAHVSCVPQALGRAPQV
jgi:hypothetical protein